MKERDLRFKSRLPNIFQTPEKRYALQVTFAERSIETKVVILERETEGIPEHAQLYGSPSILFDGSNLFGAKPKKYSSCRLYGRNGYPGKKEIIEKLESNGANRL